MDPQTALALLLACAGAPETPASAGGDLSEVEATTQVITTWLDNSGGPSEVAWSFAMYHQITEMRAIATEYENSVPAELFSEGSSPAAVALMVNTLATALEPYCTQ